MAYEVRFSDAVSDDSAQIRHSLRVLDGRARIHAAGLRARSAAGTLAEPGRLADGVTIKWIDHPNGGFFAIVRGWTWAACDVFPDRRLIVVFAVATTRELAAALGVRYSFVQTVFSSRYASRLAWPFSRPIPDDLKPPNGAAGSAPPHELM